MSSTAFLLLIVAVAVLGAIAAVGPSRPHPAARASASDDRQYDEGLRALVRVIERWLEEARTSRNVGPDPRRFATLSIPRPVLTRLRSLTRLGHETAGVLRCDDRGRQLIASSLTERAGGAMTSTVPDGLVSYHTHATPAYSSGNPVNYPSPHDALGVLALGLPGRGNACSLVAAREGIYCMRAGDGLVEHVARSVGSCAATCAAIAAAVQSAVDRHSASGDIGSFCATMRGAGFRCDFRPWPAGDGGIAFGLG